MGLLRKEDLIHKLESGAIYLTPTAAVLQSQAGSWIKGFYDTIRARFASHGLVEFFGDTQRDPTKNYLDHSFANPQAGGTGTFATDKEFWRATATSEVRSGGESLVFRNFGTVTQTWQSPFFRVAAGRAYRITVRWKADSIAAGDSLQIQLVGAAPGLGSYSSMGGFANKVAAVANIWQYDSVVEIARESPTPDTWAAVFLRKNTDGTNFTLWIDEVRVEVVPPAWRVHNNAVDQNNIGTAHRIVNFSTAVVDYYNLFDNANDRVVIKEPGLYLVGATVDFFAPITENRVQTYLNSGAALSVLSHLDQRFADSTIDKTLIVSGSALLNLARGDDIRVATQCNAAGTDILGDVAGTNFWGYKFG